MSVHLYGVDCRRQTTCSLQDDGPPLRKIFQTGGVAGRHDWGVPEPGHIPVDLLLHHDPPVEEEGGEDGVVVVNPAKQSMILFITCLQAFKIGMGRIWGALRRLVDEVVVREVARVYFLGGSREMVERSQRNR